MSEVGLVPFARVALEVSQEVVPVYSHRFSPQRFTQPQLLAILCLMRYEDWTFRAAEVRLAEHAELRQALELQTVPDYSTLFRFMLRVQEQVIAQVLAEVVRRFQSRKPTPDKAKSTVAVDATGLAPGAISTFFIRRREQHGGAAMPWRYWLKWLLAVDTRLRIILAQKAHHGPINDCATLRPLLDEVVPSNPIGTVVASSTASATTGTSVNRLARRASFRLNEASRAGSFTECVRKCGRPSPPSFIVNASMLRPYSAQSNANSQPKHRAVRSPPNANKRFYSAWPTTSISSGHLILDFHFMPEAFQQCQPIS
jgi:hypothetical protein